MKGRTRDQIDACGSHDILEIWQETIQCPADQWLQDVEALHDEAYAGEGMEEETPEHDPSTLHMKLAKLKDYVMKLGMVKD